MQLPFKSKEFKALKIFDSKMKIIKKRNLAATALPNNKLIGTKTISNKTNENHLTFKKIFRKSQSIL